MRVIKKRIIYIYLPLVFFSCSSDKYKQQLLGNWYFYNKPETAKHLNEFKIYKDSIIITDYMGKTTAKWKANELQIYLFDMNGMHDKREVRYDYKMIKKDRLVLTVHGDTLVKFNAIFRAEDAFDFLQKSINLTIDLPTTTKEIIPIGNSEFNFTIYAGFNEGQLFFKTDSSQNLDNLSSEIAVFKKNLYSLAHLKTRFVLIIDKNIIKSKKDSLFVILNQTPIKRIIQVFKKGEIDYKTNLMWHGRYKDNKHLNSY